MPPAGIELTIPASERPRTYALYRAVIGISKHNFIPHGILAFTTLISTILVIMLSVLIVCSKLVVQYNKGDKKTLLVSGDHGNLVVKALCYKSEGHWFDSSLLRA